MTQTELKEFFKDSIKTKGNLTSGEVATIMSEAPSLELKMDRDSQEYYYTINCSDLVNVNDNFLKDLKTLGWSLGEDNNFLILFI